MSGGTEVEIKLDSNRTTVDYTDVVDAVAYVYMTSEQMSTLQSQNQMSKLGGMFSRCAYPDYFYITYPDAYSSYRLRRSVQYAVLHRRNI